MHNPIIGFTNGYKGIKLYHKSYIAKENQERIILLHGAGEYSEKYTRFAEWFIAKGIDVYLLDLRGHGRSGGPRCHVDDFNNYAQDVDIFIRFTESEYGFKNTFLVSHSIGGLIAIYYGLNFKHQLGGIVVSSPCLALKLNIDPVKVWFAGLFYRFLKDRQFASHIDFKMVTHDDYMIKRFKDDPMIYHFVTAGFYAQMVKAMKYVNSRAADLKLPLLILQAGDDRICRREAAEDFYQRAGSIDKEFKLYEGFYHEVLNETERERVFEDIYTWIKKRC